MARKSKPPPGLRGSRLVIGSETYVVLSYPDGEHDRHARLTATERDVISLVLDGWTSAAIAAARGCARRTVDKHLESAYRKLGVSSRSELAAHYGATRRRGVAR